MFLSAFFSELMFKSRFQLFNLKENVITLFWLALSFGNMHETIPSFSQMFSQFSLSMSLKRLPVNSTKIHQSRSLCSPSFSRSFRSFIISESSGKSLKFICFISANSCTSFNSLICRKLCEEGQEIALYNFFYLLREINFTSEKCQKIEEKLIEIRYSTTIVELNQTKQQYSILQNRSVLIH